jgi:hypothetical protein
MAAHELSVGQSDEWYTPPEIFKAIGLQFTLDVASPGRDVVPWVPAKYCISENSLEENWFGRVWMNPPFGGRNAYLPWAEKFVQHGNGIALAPDRTSAPWWQWLAHRVDGIFFLAPKVKFIRPDGTRGEAPGTGTCLFSLDWEDDEKCTNALRKMNGTHGIFLRGGR